MPKTKLTAKYCGPKVNFLRETLKVYKRSSGLTDENIAERMGWSRKKASNALNQPADAWRLGELKRYCRIVGCPLAEAVSNYELSN